MRKVLLFVCLLMAGMTVNVNAAKQKAKHVILIGMDGWGAYSVPKADIPAIKSLMTNGCYTFIAGAYSFFECYQLGFHVYGSGNRVTWIHHLGLENSGDPFT